MAEKQKEVLHQAEEVKIKYGKEPVGIQNHEEVKESKKK